MEYFLENKDKGEDGVFKLNQCATLASVGSSEPQGFHGIKVEYFVPTPVAINQQLSI